MRRPKIVAVQESNPAPLRLLQSRIPGGSRPTITLHFDKGDARIDPRPALNFFPRSEEHTSELQSLMRISYAVFCLKKKNYTHKYPVITTRTPSPQPAQAHQT